MWDKVYRGWDLWKMSFRALGRDKRLLVFPAISGIACLGILAGFAAPLWGDGGVQQILEDWELPREPTSWGLWFAFLLANTLVIAFFNSALIACALRSLDGQEPRLGDGLRRAASRAPQILGWSLLSATVGTALRVIESRAGRVGQLVSGLGGMAWSAVSFFVVPVLVVERVGPVRALRRSTELLRKSWGEALSAEFGLGLPLAIAAAAGIAPVLIGAALGGPVATSVGIAVGVAWLLAVTLVGAAAGGVLVSALYLYAAEDRTPRQFNAALLARSFGSVASRSRSRRAARGRPAGNAPR